MNQNHKHIWHKEIEYIPIITFRCDGCGKKTNNPDETKANEKESS